MNKCTFFDLKKKMNIIYKYFSLCLPAKEQELASHWSTSLFDWHPSATDGNNKEIKLIQPRCPS